MGAGGPGGGQLEHAGPEGGHHAPLRGHRRGQRVEGVEIRHHFGIGPRVVGDGDAVAGADAEEEAPWKALFQRGDGRPDVLGCTGPDADDATGHRHVGGGRPAASRSAARDRGRSAPRTTAPRSRGTRAQRRRCARDRRGPATNRSTTRRCDRGPRSAPYPGGPPFGAAGRTGAPAVSRGGAGGRPCRRERLAAAASESGRSRAAATARSIGRKGWSDAKRTRPMPRRSP